MARVETSIFIEAPPEVVFDFVSDLPRIPEYVDFVLEIFEISEGPTRVGTTYREWAKPGPVKQLQDWRCIAFERPYRQAYEGHSREMTVILNKRLEPERNGTRYTQWIEFQMLPRIRPLGWLLDLIVRPQMKSEFKKITAGIKEIVEREYSRQESTFER